MNPNTLCIMLIMGTHKMLQLVLGNPYITCYAQCAPSLSCNLHARACWDLLCRVEVVVGFGLTYADSTLTCGAAQAGK